MRILEQRRYCIGILVLISLGSLLGRPAEAGAQNSDPDTGLVTTEAFVKKFAQRSDLPVDADERLPALRRYCFSTEAEEFRRRLGRDPEALANGLWILARYEYTALISTHSRSGAMGTQRAAAWRLEQAVQRFLAHAMQSGLVNQELWSLRMLRARSYLEEARQQVPRRLDPAGVEAAISAELIKILGPTSRDEVNRSIQTSFRDAVKTAEETVIKAVAARLQAIASLRQIYGLSPEASRIWNAQRLADDERLAFYADERYRRVKDLVEELSTGSDPATPPSPEEAASAAPDLSILGRYVELRERLALVGQSTPAVIAEGRPAPSVVEPVFGNDRRESAEGDEPTLAHVRELIEEKLQIEAPDPATSQDALKGYQDATAELAHQLTSLVGGAIAATATGPREQAEIERLRQVYPSAPGVNPAPIPWFGTVTQDALRLMLASADAFLDKQDYKRRLDDRLQRESAGRGFSAALLASLLQELEQLISREERP